MAADTKGQAVDNLLVIPHVFLIVCYNDERINELGIKDPSTFHLRELRKGERKGERGKIIQE